MRARAIVGAAVLLAVGSAASADAHVTTRATVAALPSVEVKVPGSPVAPIETTVTQPDGGTFQAVPWGDAALNGLATPDGYTLVQTAGGEWRYADGQRADGSLRPTADRPDEDPVPPGVDPNQRPAASQVEVIDVPPGSPMPGPAEAPFRPHSGNAPTLVILAYFTDQGPTTAIDDWAAKFFGATNSVKDYYDEVSYGALNVKPAAESSGNYDGVIEWVELPYVHPDVGVTKIREVNQTLARDAIVAAKDLVNYKSFDKNENGAIEPRELHITVIVAGYETSYTGSSNPANRCGKSVWGHQSTLDVWTGGTVQHPDKTPTIDGVFVGGHGGSYTMFGEKHCVRPNDPGTGHIATIGIMVHELGHDLGWPDLYDTWNGDPGGASAGVGYWSVMAYNWGSTPSSPEAGSMPSHPDPWSKIAEGWVIPKQVTGPVTIQQSSSFPDVHQILPNPNGVDWNFVSPGQAGTGEYFLVENRQQTGYDAGLPDPACGLVIYHIDETRSGDNFANSVEARRLVDVEEADGLAQLDDNSSFGDAGDPWPGSTAKTAFNDSSNPNTKLYDNSPSGVSVSGISGSGCGPAMSATIASPGPFPPGSPTIGTATAGKKADARVAFTPGSTGDGTPSYLATCTSSNGGAKGTKTGAASPLIVRNLSVGKTYRCRVLAENIVGSSAQSAASNAITPKKPPGAPINVSAVKGNDSAKVSFGPPSANGGSPITSYEARCKSSNGGVTKTKTGTGTTITVTGLSQGKTYKCDVRAKNAAGFGSYSYSRSGPVVPT